MNISPLKKFLLLLPLAAAVLSGCGAAAQENEAIRASNCALIADWNVYSNDPSTELFQGNLNSYQTRFEMEDRLWLKLQEGDKSYDALLELRKLEYSQDYWIAPPLGEKITENTDPSFRTEKDLYDEDASWEVIKKVKASCPSFPETYLAEMFAAALNM